MTPPRSRRVRIAVCITPDGESWYAVGANGTEHDDAEAANQASEYMPPSAVVHFIEADIPLPQTIVAEVKP